MRNAMLIVITVFVTSVVPVAPARAHVVIDMPAPPPNAEPTAAAPGAASANLDLGDIAFVRYSQHRTGPFDVSGGSLFGGAAAWGGWGRWSWGGGWGWGCGAYSPWHAGYSPWGGGWGGGWGCGGYRIFTTPQAYYGARYYSGVGPGLIRWGG